MRKTTFHFLLLVFAACMPQLFLLGQDSTASTSDTTTPVRVPARDSIRSRTIQLPFYTIPSNLTAASTDAVYSRDLLKNPVRNVLNALTGRLAGVFTNQGTGQPLGTPGVASDDVNPQVHGRSPLVMIDGVARTLTTLDLEEIESITVVKDAIGVAMLGVRGANDAILITTKKGTPTRQAISFTAQTAWQQPMGLSRPLNALNYATLRNEAVNNELRVRQANDTILKTLLYNAADLDSFNRGTDTFGHPNVNWQDQLFRKTSKFDRYSLSISGGNNTSRYYVSLEHLKQQGIFKESDINPYSTNTNLKSYTARTNIDINITPKLTAGIALFGRIINSTEPASSARDGNNYPVGTTGIIDALRNTPANAYPVYNRNNSFAGTGTFQNNLLAQTISSGYLEQYRRDILTDFNLRRSLNEIATGLWVKAKVSYSSNLVELTNRSRPVITFQPNANSATFTQYGTIADQVNTTAISSQGRADYFELQLGYQHNFGQHGVDVLVMQNRDNIVNGSELPYTVTGTSARVSYNFKQRYVLEGVVNRSGSNRYPGGDTRYGYFPAVGVAWNIANEGFMSGFTKMNSLKLFASYGKSGFDNPGYFSYIQRYPGGTTILGTAATGTASIMQGPIANPNITWEKVKKFNAGIRGDLLGNRLGFSVEYYNNEFSDLLITRGRNTTLLGTAYPNENIGRNRYNGVDFQLSWQSDVRAAFNYYVSANASIQNSEVLFADEQNYPDAYTFRTGNMVGRPYGYIADGLFQTAAEVAASPSLVGYRAQPGDIKLRDLNNDKIIDQRDITAIGTDKPLTIFGLNMGFTYKGFDVSALIQGVANRNIFLNGNGYYEFQNNGNGQAYEHHLNRWSTTNTEAANRNATYPRLSIGNNPNNHTFSSYWVRNGNYLRLKNAEIGYTITAGILKKVKVAGIRFFANGLNLLTASAVKDQDPEVYNGNYPIQRLYNFGINVKF